MTKLTVVSAIFLPLVSLFAFFAKEQQQRRVELEVGGVMLHLGMSKPEVAEKLAGKQYWRGNDDNWVIGGKDSAGPSIQFTNERLTFAERFGALPRTIPEWRCSVRSVH
jgi:hypothetical protein